jgi:hypothetical protein
MLRRVARRVRDTEIERGVREPSLLQVLAYARAADVPVEALIDDELDFAKQLVHRRVTRAYAKFYESE